MITRMLLAQDDLHPEILNVQALEERDQAKIGFRIRVAENIDYRLKMQVKQAGFCFYQLSEGAANNIDHTLSISWSNDHFALGLGRGMPHMAAGFILGNTMMGFSADPNANAGYFRSKTDIGNYSYNKELFFIKGNYRAHSLQLLRWDGKHVISVYTEQKHVNTGLICYLTDRPIVECYHQYKGAHLRLGVNISLVDFRLNHLNIEGLFSKHGIKIFWSLLRCSKDFQSIKTDSKWGSAIKAGSRGISSGMSIGSGSAKYKLNGTVITGKEINEQKLITDIIYKKNKMQISFGANYKKRESLKNDLRFPYLLEWQEEKQLLIKIGTKLTIDKKLQLLAQIQMNAFDEYAHSGVCRILYKKPESKLVLQFSMSSGSESGLYYLRPLSASTYFIKKAPAEDKLYVDLVYEYCFGKIWIGCLIRNEGIRFNISVR